MFLNISPYSQENACDGVSFNKVAGQKAAAVLKRDSNIDVFCEICEFLRTPILLNICK